MSTTDPPAPSSENPADLRKFLEAVRARTPARILTGRSGGSYRTATLLHLRRDHAAARDAVHAEIDLLRDLGEELVERYRLFEVSTYVSEKQTYLMRPDLGRKLSAEARALLPTRCPRAYVQVVIGDGLSAAAVKAQVPGLLPLLEQQTLQRGWTFGQPFFVRYCRVGVLNDVGELLTPDVVVLLIGERPGLATAESLSAYLAFRPRDGHTDAQRNLLSNIHQRGVGLPEAASRILSLAATMRRTQTSGVGVKEELGILGARDTAVSLLPTREGTS